MNKEQRMILKRLMHDAPLSFNQLWNKQGQSNLFAYHVKKLEERGFVVKDESGYALTEQGKQEVTYLDGETGNREEPPLLGVVVVVIEQGRVLMTCRKKEPFAGVWGYIAGKMRKDEYILECASRELHEETGITCEQLELMS